MRDAPDGPPPGLTGGDRRLGEQAHWPLPGPHRPGAQTLTAAGVVSPRRTGRRYRVVFEARYVFAPWETTDTDLAAHTQHHWHHRSPSGVRRRRSGSNGYAIPRFGPPHDHRSATPYKNMATWRARRLAVGSEPQLVRRGDRSGTRSGAKRPGPDRRHRAKPEARCAPNQPRAKPHDRAARSVARPIATTAHTLGNWVAAERRGAAPGAVDVDERAELVRLGSENATLRMARDVLKRSVVLWVNEATK